MRLDRVYHCEGCNYDLTGLRETGRCPECGSTFNVRSGEGVVEPRWATERSQLPTWMSRTVAAGVIIGVALLACVILGDPTLLWIGIAIAIVLGLGAVRKYHER
jgi:hypothetical protein